MHGHKESNKDLNLKILTSEWDSNQCLFDQLILAIMLLSPKTHTKSKKYE